ncbi:MAG: hypothetical protein K0Q47_864 [Sedimentibacter sp.]|nr:hypothetical protein [Sedimentibacter sp.]
MPLKEKLMDDLKEAMKSKEKVRKNKKATDKILLILPMKKSKYY